MGYDKVNLGDVTDQAAEHGFGELQEARFPREDVGTEASGLAHIKVKPGQRQPFAHKHGEAEELHLILSGSGTMKVDDELIEVGPLDVIRVDPALGARVRGGRRGARVRRLQPPPRRRRRDRQGLLGRVTSG